MRPREDLERNKALLSEVQVLQVPPSSAAALAGPTPVPRRVDHPGTWGRSLATVLPAEP